MFNETSHEKLFFTEHWPTSTSMIKGNFSKSFNSLNNMKMKSFSNLSSSSFFTSSHSIFNSNDNIMDIIKNLNTCSSQGSILDIIEEE